MRQNEPTPLTFSEILEGKLQESSPSEVHFESESQSTPTKCDPSVAHFWNEILSFAKPKTEAPAKYFAYKLQYKSEKRQKKPTKNSPPSREKPVQANPQETQCPVQSLSVAGLAALRVLDIQLYDDFITLSQIKRAFRRLAYQLHPDLNPSANTEAFTSAKEAFDILKRELQK